MSRTKIPGSQDWFWNDWCGSPRVRALNDAEYRAYHLLLGCCWQLGGSLPSRCEDLCRLVPEAAHGVTPRVIQMFEEHPKRLDSLTHHKVFAQLKWYEQRTEAGSASAESRKSTKRQREAQRNVNERPNETANETSSLPAPSSLLPSKDLPAPRSSKEGGGGISSIAERLRTLWGFLDDEALSAIERFELVDGDVDDWDALPRLRPELFSAVANPKSYVRSLIARYGRVADASLSEPPKSRELAEDEARSRALKASTEAVRHASEASKAAAVPPPFDVGEVLRQRKAAAEQERARRLAEGGLQ